MPKHHEVTTNTPSTQQVRQWHEHTLELMDGGASVDKLGSFVITKAQYDELHAPLELPAVPSESKQDTKTAEAEKTFDREAFGQLLDSTDFVMSSYIHGVGTTEYGVRKGEFGFSGSSADLKIGSLMDRVSYADPYKKFNDTNIPEVFAMQELSEQIWNDLKRPEPTDDRNTVNDIRSMSRTFAQKGPMALIRYAASSTPNFRYADSHDRAGNSARFAMVIPLETALSLFAAVQNNPNVAHDLLDLAASKAMDPRLRHNGGPPFRQQNPYETEWPQMKPPIEEWRQANGGKVPMAFQNSLLQEPSQATVVEY